MHPVIMSDDKPSKRVVIRANKVQTEILKEAYTKFQTVNVEQLESLFEQTGLPKKWISNWFMRQRKKNRVKQEDVFKAEYQEPALDTVTTPKRSAPKRTKKAMSVKQLVTPKLEYPDEDEIQLLSSPLPVSKAFDAYHELSGSSPSTAISTNHSQAISAPTPAWTAPINADGSSSQQPWIAPSTDRSHMLGQPQFMPSPWPFDAKENLPDDYMRTQVADHMHYNGNIPSSVSCAMPYTQASFMQQQPSFMDQLQFPRHHSYPPTSALIADTLNPQLTPLRHLSVLANQNYPNDASVLSACLLDEQLGQNDPFQAAMGLVYLSRLGLNW
ncbi:uncharacterized protein BT62DRAFT_181338 [Guyanagaster necrorhizus]|uniref:Homeobox domain-containing protein n=1 Tax=Guyanagaster necrorhizus TaxID=856835 RepID=A0A9P7VTJ1_9AGAR|nr:uncharacterized protein BT62DRAFT_181338 [Guyanagaster necrorhizus MCA 3950]KAG7445814.1 hypothetical protein BT62DRAFT_181338 [Guyanagaster necrorhizus MCA 3950]